MVCCEMHIMVCCRWSVAYSKLSWTYDVSYVMLYIWPAVFSMVCMICPWYVDHMVVVCSVFYIASLICCCLCIFCLSVVWCLPYTSITLGKIYTCFVYLFSLLCFICAESKLTSRRLTFVHVNFTTFLHFGRFYHHTSWNENIKCLNHLIRLSQYWIFLTIIPRKNILSTG